MTTQRMAGAAGQAAASPAAEEPMPRSITVPNILGWLGARALQDATEDELIACAGLAADAQAIAERGAAVAHGVAHLVRADSDGMGAGDFRDPEDVAHLLLHLGDVFGLVAGLVNVSEQAEGRLRLASGSTKAFTP